MKHTPTPWKIDEALDLPLAIISDTDDGMGVAEMGERSPESIANAAFIVKTCNAHDELLAACKEALELLYGLSSGCHTKQRAEEYVAGVLALKRAISKAEGSE